MLCSAKIEQCQPCLYRLATRTTRLLSHRRAWLFGLSQYLADLAGTQLFDANWLSADDHKCWRRYSGTHRSFMTSRKNRTDAIRFQPASCGWPLRLWLSLWRPGCYSDFYGG